MIDGYGFLKDVIKILYGQTFQPSSFVSDLQIFQTHVFGYRNCSVIKSLLNLFAVCQDAPVGGKRDRDHIAAEQDIFRVKQGESAYDVLPVKSLSGRCGIDCQQVVCVRGKGLLNSPLPGTEVKERAFAMALNIGIPLFAVGISIGSNLHGLAGLKDTAGKWKIDRS